MGVEILTPSFQDIAIGETDIALAVPLILYSLLDVSLLCEFVDDDGGDHVGEQDLEESPIDQVRHESAIVVLFRVADTLPNDLLRVQGPDARDDRVAVLVDVVDVDVDFLVVVEGPNVVVEGDEAEDEGEGQGQQAYEHQLLPSQPDGLEYALQ